MSPPACFLIDRTAHDLVKAGGGGGGGGAREKRGAAERIFGAPRGGGGKTTFVERPGFWGRPPPPPPPPLPSPNRELYDKLKNRQGGGGTFLTNHSWTRIFANQLEARGKTSPTGGPRWCDFHKCFPRFALKV